MTTTSGILLVDKAPDWTSHDVVSFIRGFGFKKVGHAGTLDPAATGLLIILIGKHPVDASQVLVSRADCRWQCLALHSQLAVSPP